MVNESREREAGSKSGIRFEHRRIRPFTDKFREKVTSSPRLRHEGLL
jgi:hypothetical protein